MNNRPAAAGEENTLQQLSQGRPTTSHWLICIFWLSANAQIKAWWKWWREQCDLLLMKRIAGCRGNKALSKQRFHRRRITWRVKGRHPLRLALKCVNRFSLTAGGGFDQKEEVWWSLRLEVYLETRHLNQHLDQFRLQNLELVGKKQRVSRTPLFCTRC